MATVEAAEPFSVTGPAREKDRNLQLYVVFTDIRATRAALDTASHLGHDLNARIVLLVAKVVPYPLSLEAPPVSDVFTAGVLSQLAAEQDRDVSVRVYLCRDRNATIRHVLRPGSLVVIGRHQPWWRNRTPLLARLLKRDGHAVIVASIRRIQPARTGPVKVESSR